MFISALTRIRLHLNRTTEWRRTNSLIRFEIITEPKKATKAMNFDCLFRSVDKGDFNSPEIMLRNDEKMRAAIFEIQP